MQSKLNRTCLLCSTFLIMTAVFSPVKASNRSQVHNDAATFEETWNGLNPNNQFKDYADQDNYFPVGWSGPWGVYGLLEQYSEEYCNNQYDVKSHLQGILNEMQTAGMNFVFLRGTISSLNKDSYYDVSNWSMNIGLNVIAGGFETACQPESTGYNGQVYYDWLSDYFYDLNEKYPGHVIGTGGMDCPDAAHAATEDETYFYVTRYWASNKCEGVGFNLGGINIKLPFSCLLEEQGYGDFNNWNWSIGLWPGGSYPHPFINRYCNIMSLPSYDWYPCGSFTARMFGLLEEADRWIAADVLPEDCDYYNAYADRDEMIALDLNNVGVITYDVYEISGTSQALEFETTCTNSGTVPGRWTGDFQVTSSGPLSADDGNRTYGTHNLNGGVAFWEMDCHPSRVQILYYGGNDIVLGHLNDEIREHEVKLISLGQDDYYINHEQDLIAEGMVCQESMRVMCCYEDINDQQYVSIYETGSDPNDFNFTRVCNIELGFVPAYAIWGYFWRCGDFPWTYSTSGFVICDATGTDWRVIHRESGPGGEDWEMEVIDNPFTDAAGLELADLDVLRQTTGWRPNFAPQYDYLVGTYAENGSDSFELHIKMGKTNAEDDYEFFSSSCIVTVQCPVYAAISDMTIINNHSRSVIYCNYYDSSSDSEPAGMFSSNGDFKLDIASSEIDIVASVFPWCLSENCAFRIRPTRKCITLGLLINIGNGEARVPVALRTSVFHPNLYSRLSRGIHHEHHWGVVQTGLQGHRTCLMTTVQAFGRSKWSRMDYCPTLDEMMYLSVSPVVHGARALHYYSLLHALEASYGDVTNRLPSEVTCWNASDDPESPDLDLVSTVHAAVAILTGNEYTPPYGGGGTYGSSFDFLSTVVNDEWEAIVGLGDSDLRALHRAFLVNGNLEPVDDDSLNFLALRNPLGDEILVLFANDYKQEAPDLSILFEYFNDYEIEWIYHPGAWSPTLPLHAPGIQDTEIYNTHNIIEIAQQVMMSADICNSVQSSTIEYSDETRSGTVVGLCGYPAFSAGLFRLYYPNDSSNLSDAVILDENSLKLLNSVGASVDVHVNVAEDQDFTISVYDMFGRIVSRDRGTGSAIVSYSIETNPAGAYFVMLESGNESMVKRMVLLP